MAKIDITRTELVWPGKYNDDGTHKDRKLALTADPHTYDKAGRYRILVKMVDIFGSDTSQVYDVEV